MLERSDEERAQQIYGGLKFTQSLHKDFEVKLHAPVFHTFQIKQEENSRSMDYRNVGMNIYSFQMRHPNDS